MIIEEKSVGVVLKNKDKYLLLHYPHGHWDFVKGHIEENESEHQTLKRELKEETGIVSYNITEGFREEIDYHHTQKGKQFHKVVVFYLATTNETNVLISHEHKDHLWLPFEQALDQLTFKNAKNILEKAHDFNDSRTSSA